MRFAPFSAALAAVTTAAVLATVPSTGSATSAGYASTQAQTEASGEEVLQDAERAIRGRVPTLFTRGADSGSSPTVATAALQSKMEELAPDQQVAARRLLARPTEGLRDRNGDGYSVKEATPYCTKNFCVHYVRSGKDAPSLADVDGNGVPDSVQRTGRMMERIWAFQVGTLGFRPPLSDGKRGGNGKFDVYLANVGAKGYYGYCAAEKRGVQNERRASGYCVLDNDYAEFPRKPVENLAVTASHEFFHAIQFGYDYTEDQWFMEATATWMEEQFANEINDNRRYLASGQLNSPQTPLDAFQTTGLSQYGQWIFIQRLSQAYGQEVARRLWVLAQATPKDSGRSAVAAIDHFLKRRGTSMAQFYARFAADNLTPGRSYTEGKAYKPSPVTKRMPLRAGKPVSVRTRLDHLTYRTYVLRPKKVSATKRLVLRFQLPPEASGARAFVVRHDRGGKLTRRPVTPNPAGRTVVRLRVKPSTQRVSVTLANGSTRFSNCGGQTSFTCKGTPRDEGRRFGFRARLR